MKEENENQEQIKGGILTHIRSGAVTMRPKWHFILHTALISTGTLLLIFGILYLTSFILFLTDASGISLAPHFGPPGWFSFFRSLPWLLIFLSLLFVIILELLVQHYTFAYRIPLLISIFCIILLAFFGGIFFAPLHRGLFRAARHGIMNAGGGFYQSFSLNRNREIYRGTVSNLGTSNFILEDFEGETSTIILPPPMSVQMNPHLIPGDEVVVFGNSSGTTVQAKAIRVLKHTEPNRNTE